MFLAARPSEHALHASNPRTHLLDRCARNHPRRREAPEAVRSSVGTNSPCAFDSHTCRPSKPSQHSEGSASHFTENGLPRDYFLPVSFSRHAAQPPSPVSRGDAGSCRPTRRIASITSSAGMIGPTPESARFAAHGAEARSIHARRLLSIQPARRAASFAGFAKGRGKLSAHAAHRVDHLVRGHDQPHARNCGVRGAWR